MSTAKTAAAPVVHAKKQRGLSNIGTKDVATGLIDMVTEGHSLGYRSPVRYSQRST